MSGGTGIASQPPIFLIINNKDFPCLRQTKDRPKTDHIFFFITAIVRGFSSDHRRRCKREKREMDLQPVECFLPLSSPPLMLLNLTKQFCLYLYLYLYLSNERGCFAHDGWRYVYTSVWCLARLRELAGVWAAIPRSSRGEVKGDHPRQTD